jgi:hypothetical protein
MNLAHVHHKFRSATRFASALSPPNSLNSKLNANRVVKTLLKHGNRLRAQIPQHGWQADKTFTANLL